MTERRNAHLASGIVAGIAGGLVASWVMNEFMENVGPSLQKAVQGEDAAEQQQPQDGEKPDDATMKTADAVVSTVHRRKAPVARGQGERRPDCALCVRRYHGCRLWSNRGGDPGDDVWFRDGIWSGAFCGRGPCGCAALNLSGSPADAPVSSLATPFAAHLVYGAATEAVRKLVRALL